MKLFGIDNAGTPALRLIFGIIGVLLVLGVWILLTTGPGIFPSPLEVIRSFPQLINENELFKHIGLSLGLNITGYIEAILIVIPLGFIIGLIKYARWAFQRQVDALRYVPLTAVTLLFILWFGIEIPMKVHFLAFGILIYLLPVMVQRIDEVDDVYLKTVHTLGATDWQVLKRVYIPSVLSRLSDDIRVLTAISWTYIIVAEGVNSTQGGLGTLIYYVGQRQGRYDKVFAILLIIMIIGVLQDKVFVWLDREFFPHKYQASEAIKSSRIKQKGIISVILDYVLVALGWISLGIYFILMLNDFMGFLGGLKPLSYLFGDTVWVIHIIVTALLLYKAWKWNEQRMDTAALRSVRTKTAVK
ncbi:MAG TPA: ABC transporter permease subunit [Saprospiraceae bacterium]|nr:ABC transporter permease subunit [Saprospiraceae bacterium]